MNLLLVDNVEKNLSLKIDNLAQNNDKKPYINSQIF